MHDVNWSTEQIHLSSDLEDALTSQLRKAEIKEEEGQSKKTWVDVTFDCFNTDDNTDPTTY